MCLVTNKQRSYGVETSSVVETDLSTCGTCLGLQLLWEFEEDILQVFVILVEITAVLSPQTTVFLKRPFSYVVTGNRDS